MHRHLRLWLILSFLLAAGMLAGGFGLQAKGNLPAHDQARIALIIGGGFGLLGVTIAGLCLRRPLNRLLARPDPAHDPPDPLVLRHPYLTMFLISFVALFLEVLFIRYCNSQIRIFSFYKNVPLVSCFLGMALGCCLGSGRSRHALAFLLWLVPLVVFLSQGVLAIDGYLDAWAAAGSSEHILGDFIVARPATGSRRLFTQLLMGLFCVAMLVAITSLFVLIGRLLGDAFERLARLPAYTMNILGSLAGILAFTALSYLQTSPWTWFLVGLVPILWWVSGRRRVCAAVVLIALTALASAPSHGDTVWSRYQKLVGHPVVYGEDTDHPIHAYLVQISNVFYQIAFDLRPESIAHLPENPLPHYDRIYSVIPKPERVLIVGAGTGNDVAAALRAGAEHVDAVDIDPAIVEMGRLHHAERPYDDPRTHVIIDDARSAFRRLPPQSYDAVIFGLLDSHTQLGISSVRLDNYVFTLESFAAARRLLKPGGHMIITAATFRDWFRERFPAMLATVSDSEVQTYRGQNWTTTWVLQVEDPSVPPPDPMPRASITLPTDDWPFLYLPKRGIPVAYMIVVGMLAVASIIMLRVGGLSGALTTSYHTHLFFLGAAFLLMEVYAINRLALLFGTTWIVSAVTIAIVLFLIICANLTIIAIPRIPYAIAYAGLIATLLITFGLDPASVLGKGLLPILVYGLLLLSPIYFAGLVFARSFRVAPLAGPAIGVNILGSVLGGWVEYATMAVGIRAMVLLALAFYLASLIALLRARKTMPTTLTDASPVI